MGMSTDALLVYGFDLGSDEIDGWKFREVDSYGDPRFPWYGPNSVDDFVEVLEMKLLTTIGFDPDIDNHPSWDAYHAAKKAAQKTLGVEVVRYGHIEYSGWILAAYEHSVHESRTWLISPTELLEKPIDEQWNIKLSNAIEGIGMSFDDMPPGWLLTARTG